jgi:hypothetical protein
MSTTKMGPRTMRITIDTFYKTVEVSNENLKEVVDFLSAVYPETWQEFKITSSTTWTMYPGTTYEPPATDFITYCSTISNQQN